MHADLILNLIMKKKHLLIGLAIIVSLLIACGLIYMSKQEVAIEIDDSEQMTVSSEEEVTPVYVVWAGHIENGDHYAVCDIYDRHESGLLEFARFIDSYGLPFNMQIDYKLFEGALNCDGEEDNVINTIATEYGFEIDPHKGGGFEDGLEQNYADVRYIGGQITSGITEIVGGIIWNDQGQYLRLNEGEAGVLNPDFVWEPEILTLGVHFKHHNGDFSLDDLTSGIWIPRGFEDQFWEHDEDGTMVYVAPGMQHSNWFDNRQCYFDSSADYVEVLAEYIGEGRLPAGKMYTNTIAIPQKVIFDPEMYSYVEDQIKQLQPLVDQGKVKYVSYTELVEIWRSEYNSEPNMVLFEEISAKDYTCEAY